MVSAVAGLSGQRSGTVGLVLEPTLYGEVSPGTSFTLTPLYRFDSADSRRTHADLREAYVLTHGEWGESFWELRVGLDRVFWGVAEVHNLVDIVNQVDSVEHPRDRPKLGQPMAHLTVSGDWGIAEAFVLPYHRKRTFPGRSGRHRSGRLIDQHARYESGAKERHVDLAVRYGNAVGLLDFGLSAFVGTSRDPWFLAARHSEPLPALDAPLTPYYEQIRQIGSTRSSRRSPGSTRWKASAAADREISWAGRRTTARSFLAWNARSTGCSEPGRT